MASCQNECKKVNIVQYVMTTYSLLYLVDCYYLVAQAVILVNNWQNETGIAPKMQ